MASGGTYRIDAWIAPAPPETSWDDEVLDDGLNAIPIVSGYRPLTWTIGDMDGCDFEDLCDKQAEQQAGNAQLGELETDPYGASGADKVYGTTVYTDFVIKPLNRRRGLPHYKNVVVNFLVFVS